MSDPEGSVAPLEHSVTVMVTGAGGPAGVSVVRALSRMGHTVVAVDTDPLAAGLYLAERSALVPEVDDARYVDALVDVARSSGASALVPTLAEELGTLSEAHDRLQDAGLAHWLPDPAAVRRCTDKWEFSQVLLAAGISAPPTSLGSADGLPGPWVVKPRFGRGSRDVTIVDDPGEMPFVLARVTQPIVQAKLEGREFTVDALVGRDGQLAGAVPRWRNETRGGISTKGVTFADERLTGEVARLLRTLQLVGPANVQGFVRQDGLVSFTEVNPRFSGGLPLSLAAGADLVGEYLHCVLGGQPRSQRLKFRPGTSMTRYFEEIIQG
jgi:carbamoyl-phosphate synthase large subunit